MRESRVLCLLLLNGREFEEEGGESCGVDRILDEESIAYPRSSLVFQGREDSILYLIVDAHLRFQ